MKPRYFRLAQQIANKSDHARHKLGCIIIRKNRILGLGFNRGSKTSVNSPTPFKSIHAEYDALASCRYEDLKGAVAYVYRNSKTGPRISKPCPQCETMLKSVGIKKVYYSINEYPFYNVDIYT